MSDLRFVWEDRKNKVNVKKHGISFEEARTGFLDESARLIADPDHSSEEDRFILLGLSTKLRVLAVSHCYRESENVIRIISARKTTAAERSEYVRWSS